MCHLTVCPLKEHPAAKVSLILLNFDNPAERSKKNSGTEGEGYSAATLLNFWLPDSDSECSTTFAFT